MAALEEDVAAVSWMTPQTRRRALDKLATYDAQVGAPHRWKDYGGPCRRRHAATRSGPTSPPRADSDVEADRRRVGKPTDRDVWQLPASSSSAYIDAQLNQIVLPAGFLLTIGYRLRSATTPELYGGIGAGIAHDLTHALDAGGADFDSQGRPMRWWSDADRTRFEARAACVDDVYSAFEVEPGLHLDGKRVESEAIGDLGGVRLGYRALSRALAARSDPGPRRPRAAEQRYFIAWARSRAEAVAPRDRTPDRRRAIRTRRAASASSARSSTCPSSSRAFACKADAKMVRSPEQRCTVW